MQLFGDQDRVSSASDGGSSRHHRHDAAVAISDQPSQHRVSEREPSLFVSFKVREVLSCIWGVD